MGAKVEVVVGRVSDVFVHNGPCRDVATLPHLEKIIIIIIMYT